MKTKGKKSKEGFEYQYFIKDHLGNTRVMLSQTGKVLQQNAYYPFGMLISMPQPDLVNQNKYLYNGKELQTDFGLDWYDYGARFYDAELGRWHVPDLMAEKYYSLSTYNYAMNNPIALIDPDGRSTDWYQSASGALIWQDENKKQITVNGEKFNNVGTSASIGTGDGSYVNYYQNVPVSTSDAPVNAEQTVLNNEGLKGQLLGKDSPLSEKSQIGLMQSSIHKGPEDFLTTSISVVENSLSNVGTGTTVVGYGTLMFPGGQVFGAGLIGVGKAMTTTAGLLQIGINLKEKNYGQASVNSVFMFGNMLTGSKLNSLNLGNQSKLILKTGADLKINLYIRNLS